MMYSMTAKTMKAFLSLRVLNDVIFSWRCMYLKHEKWSTNTLVTLYQEAMRFPFNCTTKSGSNEIIWVTNIHLTGEVMGKWQIFLTCYCIQHSHLWVVLKCKHHISEEAHLIAFLKTLSTLPMFGGCWIQDDWDNDATKVTTLEGPSWQQGPYHPAL